MDYIPIEYISSMSKCEGYKLDIDIFINLL